MTTEPVAAPSPLRLPLVGTIDVSNAHQWLSRWPEAPGVVMVDAAGLERADSAAVALLLAWRRRANARGQRLIVTNAPAALRTLAQIYGVEALLEWQP